MRQWEKTVINLIWWFIIIKLKTESLKLFSLSSLCFAGKSPLTSNPHGLAPSCGRCGTFDILSAPLRCVHAPKFNIWLWPFVSRDYCIVKGSAGDCVDRSMVFLHSVTRVPARALMRERSKSRAELFSLSQSCSAARSQRLLMSLYCCWISRLSKSVGEMVLMVSRLEENTFNLQFTVRQTDRERDHLVRLVVENLFSFFFFFLNQRQNGVLQHILWSHILKARAVFSIIMCI